MEQDGQHYINEAMVALANQEKTYAGRVRLAIVSYERAATAFTLANQWVDAASACVAMANLASGVGTAYNAACYHNRAGFLFLRSPAHQCKAIVAWREAAGLFLVEGMFGRAAEVFQTIAAHGEDVDAALDFEQAARYYELEESRATGASCWERAGRVHENGRRWEDAKRCYQAALAYHEKSELTQFRATALRGDVARCEGAV